MELPHAPRRRRAGPRCAVPAPAAAPAKPGARKAAIETLQHPLFVRKTGLVVEARKGGRKGKDQGPTELHFIDENEPVKSGEYPVLVGNW